MIDSDSKTSSMIFLDEASYSFATKDTLVEKIREVSGVPNARYLVEDEQVFVFDKLVILVTEHQKISPTTSIESLALKLKEESFVSPIEAVRQWGVMPEPYELVEKPNDGFMIRHRAFNASLPIHFQSKDSAHEALAGLLIGTVQPGKGEFTYKGQSMSLCDPLDPALLPPRPEFEIVEKPLTYPYSFLSCCKYIKGFQPISEELFNDVRDREAQWALDSARVSQFIDRNREKITSLLPVNCLETLNDVNGHVPEYAKQETSKLRSLYPELSMMTDGSLFSYFDHYQSEWLDNDWTAYRDDEFFFYLLRKVAERQHEEQIPAEVWRWAAYSLLRGDSLGDALAIGRAADLYDNAISHLARRISEAMRFLANEENTTELHGPPITTIMDLFMLGRKRSFASVTIEQNVSDFGAETAAFKRVEP